MSTEGERVFVLVLEPEEEITRTLIEFASREKLTGARLSAVGAVRRTVLGYFDHESKQYRRNIVDEQCEVASLTGTIAVQDGETKLHAHCVLGQRDGSTLAGHLLEAHVWPTLEVVVSAYSGTLNRQNDPETGLALLVP